MKFLTLPAWVIIVQVFLLFRVGIALGAGSPSSSSTSMTTTSTTNTSTTVNSTTVTSTTVTSTTRNSSTTTTSNPSTRSNTSVISTSTSTAQYPSLTGIPPCATTCFETAISDANCSSVVDVNCFCASGKFPQGIVSCISTNCPTLLNSTEELAQQFCNLATSSSLLSFPTPTTSSTATSGTATATVLSITTSATSSVASSPTATQKGAAVGLGWGRGREDGRMLLVGVGVCLLSFVGGALCI